MADIDSERELVTIQSFRELPEAMLAKGMLNSAGIECFLLDDNTGRMLGFVSDVIGGIKMQVSRDDAEAAMKLLGQPIPVRDAEGSIGSDQQPRCPHCYSADISFQEYDKPVTQDGAWLSLSAPLREKVGECKSCGYQWDD